MEGRCRSLTLLRTGNPITVGISMKDPATRTYTGSHSYFTQPNMSEETIAMLSQFNSKKKASSNPLSSIILILLTKVPHNMLQQKQKLLLPHVTRKTQTRRKHLKAIGTEGQAEAG